MIINCKYNEQGLIAKLEDNFRVELIGQINPADEDKFLSGAEWMVSVNCLSAYNFRQRIWAKPVISLSLN